MAAAASAQVVVDGVGCRLNFKSSRVTVGTSKTARKLGISFPFVADATQASAAQVEDQVRARASTRWLRGLQQILRQIVQLLMMLWWSRAAPSQLKPLLGYRRS